MIEQKYIRIILCSLLFSLCLCHQSALSEQIDDDQHNGIDVGRDDPFAQLLEKKPPAPVQVASAAADERRPELLLEIVHLKSLDARNISGVVEKMLSQNGSISINAKTNSLIIWDTKENIEMILAQIQRVDWATAPQPPAIREEHKPEVFVETITLKFLNAGNFKDVIGKMFSEYGSISIDAKSNSLIICDTKENLEKILAKISKADKTPAQIMIEVVIIDVQLGDDSEIGINWDILSNKNHSVGYRQSLGFTPRLKSTAQTATTIGDATAFATTGAGSDFSIIIGTIRNVIHMLQEIKNVEILASPRVMVVSGRDAFIEAVEELPYNEIVNTSEGGQLSGTSFKKVGVKLRVNAILTDDNLIHLVVNSEQSVATGTSATDVPEVDTRNVQTSLLLEDGQVVVMGGLRRKETTKQVKQVPILGDIPVIGALFKSTNMVENHSELIVFLSPHIYKGAPLSEEEMAKFKEMSERPMLSLPGNENSVNE